MQNTTRTPKTVFTQNFKPSSVSYTLPEVETSISRTTLDYLECQMPMICGSAPPEVRIAREAARERAEQAAPRREHWALEPWPRIEPAGTLKHR